MRITFYPDDKTQKSISYTTVDVWIVGSSVHIVIPSGYRVPIAYLSQRGYWLIEGQGNKPFLRMEITDK